MIFQKIPQRILHKKTVFIKKQINSYNFTENSKAYVIIDKIINETDYDGSINTKELQSIILKSSVGKRSLNGKIRKDGKQLSGYTNIIFIPSKED